MHETRRPSRGGRGRAAGPPLSSPLAGPRGLYQPGAAQADSSCTVKNIELWRGSRPPRTTSDDRHARLVVFP